MHKRLSLLIALSLAAPAALAANGDWTGWHLGGHAGHGSGNSDADVTLGGQWSIESQALRDHVSSTWSTGLDPSGSAYGLLFGYDHQFASGFVLGGELDYSKLGIDDSRATGPQPVPSAPSLSYDFANSIELDDKWSARLRFGYASGRHLFFATAGWIQVDAEATAAVASNGGYLKLGRQSDTVDGVEWGVGYEFDFGNQWSLRGEYLMADLDDLRYDTEYQPGSTFVTPAYLESVRQDLDFDTFRIALNYRF
jgi:opacity protein-like surface antigen